MCVLRHAHPNFELNKIPMLSKLRLSVFVGKKPWQGAFLPLADICVFNVAVHREPELRLPCWSVWRSSDLTRGPKITKVTLSHKVYNVRVLTMCHTIPDVHPYQFCLHITPSGVVAPPSWSLTQKFGMESGTIYCFEPDNIIDEKTQEIPKIKTYI